MKISMLLSRLSGFALVLGACLALFLSKYAKKWHERYTVPVSSGIIAGESLMGVAIALVTALPNLAAMLKK